KLSPSGSALVYSTYLGGSVNESANSIAVDASGAAYVAGYTESTDFPVKNACRDTRGGTEDAFVTKLDPAGSDLVYSTHLGGNDASSYAYANDVFLFPSGAVYVIGETNSTSFPTVNPIQ